MRGNGSLSFTRAVVLVVQAIRAQVPVSQGSPIIPNGKAAVEFVARNKLPYPILIKARIRALHAPGLAASVLPSLQRGHSKCCGARTRFGRRRLAVAAAGNGCANPTPTSSRSSTNAPKCVPWVAQHARASCGGAPGFA
jgi:hypothetical protein